MSAAADTPTPRVRAGKLCTPLQGLFRLRAYTPRMGLNWLQERGHISDLCVTLADVAPVDAAAAVARFRARWSPQDCSLPTAHCSLPA